MKGKKRLRGNSVVAGLLFMAVFLVAVVYVKDRYFLYRNEKAYTARYSSGDRSLQTYSQLALVYEKKGEYDRSIGLMQEFLRENPDHPDAYEAYAQIAMAYHLKAQDDPDDVDRWRTLARENLDSASSLLPAGSYAHYSQGLYYETLELNAEAMKYFQSALDLLEGGKLEEPFRGMERGEERLRSMYEKAIQRARERMQGRRGTP